MTRWVLAGLLVGAWVGGDGAAAQDAGAARWEVAESRNEARYLVREQLAGFEFPNDAVGRTAGIRGGITIAPDGSVVPEESRIEIDLAALQSDESRRDNYLRRNTLETETYPTAVFVPRQVRGLTGALDGSARSFEVIGDLTVKDVTRSVTWMVTARMDGNTLRGTARTQFTFDEMGLTKPSLARLLSVADEIRLEYDFGLVRPGG